MLLCPCDLETAQTDQFTMELPSPTTEAEKIPPFPPGDDKEMESQVGFCAPCVADDSSSLPPVARIILPADVADFTEEDDSVYIIGTREGKVTKIAGLEKMTKLKVC